MTALECTFCLTKFWQNKKCLRMLQVPLLFLRESGHTSLCVCASPFMHSCPSSLSPPLTQGEMLLYFSSLPVIRARQQWSFPLPNRANVSFNFYYFLVVTMLLYIPREWLHVEWLLALQWIVQLLCKCCWYPVNVMVLSSLALYWSHDVVFPQLYGHMIQQRRKIIGGQQSVPTTKKTNWSLMFEEKD